MEAGHARPKVAIVQLDEKYLSVVQGDPFQISFTADLENNTTAIDYVELRNFNIDTVAGTVSNVIANMTSSPFTVNTTGWEPGLHRLALLSHANNSGKLSYPDTLDVFIEDPNDLDFAENLVNEIVDTSNLEVSEPVFSGMNRSAGIFTEGFESGLSMDEGVILTTGLAEVWNNGNTVIGHSQKWFSPGDLNWYDRVDENGVLTDRHLDDRVLEDRVVGGATSDASAVEFTINPDYSKVTYEIQMASEEYLSWVANRAVPNSSNDALAVSIDGVLVSLLPDCEEIIGVHSIHPTVTPDLSSTGKIVPPRNSRFYINKDDLDSFDFSPIVDGPRLQYDSATVKFKGTVFLTPGKEYRVKMMIADVGFDLPNTIRDSAVFIKKSSLKCPAPTE